MFMEKELFFEGDARLLDGGDACIRLIGTDANGNALRNRFGRVRYQPEQLGDLDTTVVFKMSKSGNSKYPGNGLVFFVVPEGHRFPPIPIGPELGVFNRSGSSPGVVAVEFNVFADEDTGRVYKRVGIDVESDIPVACRYIPAEVVGREISLSINYAAATGFITARARVGEETFPPVTCSCDLRSILPPVVEFGLAASTGEGAAAFDVISWEGI